MYTVGKIGLEKGRLEAIRDRIRGRISEANTILAMDPATAHMLQPKFGGRVEQTCVRLGDLESSWDIKRGGPLKIRVFAGAGREGTAAETQVQYLGHSLRKVRLWTTISAFFHVNAFDNTDPEDMLEAAEIARANIADWLRNVVLDTSGTLATHASLPLTSQEYQAENATSYDRLCPTWIQASSRGFFNFSYQDSIVAYGVSVLHYGEIG